MTNIQFNRETLNWTDRQMIQSTNYPENNQTKTQIRKLICKNIQTGNHIIIK